MSSKIAYEEIECTDGNFYKIASNAKVGTFIVPMNPNTLISISVHSQLLKILVKDSNEIFRYVGDISFSSLEEQNTFHLHATRVSGVTKGDQFFDGLTRENIETLHLEFKVDPDHSSTDSLRDDD